MRLIEEVQIHLDFNDLRDRQPLARPARQSARAAGIHLSGILRHIVHVSRMPNWEQYASEIEAPTRYPLIWFLGVAWEEAVASLYESWMWQPGQTVWRDISMNVDGLSCLDDYGLVIEEAKYTSCKRKSGAEFMQDWLKMQQGAGYCLGYGMDAPALVRWHVCWNNRPWAPEYWRYLVEFDDKDLRESGQMLEANKQGAVEAGYGE